MEIRNLKNYKFRDAIGVYTIKGFAIYEQGKGFVSLDNKTPYSPIGGKKALQSIIDAGGFVGNVNYIQALEA